jgi:hypothetical protein
MNVLLVTYDGSDAAAFSAFIEGVTKFHTRLSDSAFAIRTTNSPEAIVKRAREALGEAPVWVITATTPYHGTGAKATDSWLRNNLP